MIILMMLLITSCTNINLTHKNKADTDEPYDYQIERAKKEDEAWKRKRREDAARSLENAKWAIEAARRHKEKWEKKSQAESVK